MMRFTLKCFVYVLGGFFIGVLACNILMQGFGLRCNTRSFFVHPVVQSGTIDEEVRHGNTIPPKSNIYLGMMSASKFLTTRVQRNIDTWLQKGGWKVEVFADADPSLLRVPPGLDINVVTLPAVDDTAYPPQKKSFMLLRHMYDYHINDFDWFIRSDDDSYTDFPRMQNLLNKINSSLPIFFGNPGFGMDEDDGIEEGMKYLMGGLGMIFSRGLLIQLRPHLKHCIQHLYSPHEDIEIGRCVWKHTKAITPVAWETVDLFYQQYDKETGDVINIIMDQLTPKRTAKTITYHSVKTEELVNKLHHQILRRNLHQILNRTSRIRNEIAHMRQMLELHEDSPTKEKSMDSTVPILLGTEDKFSWKNDGNPWPEGAYWYPTGASYNRISFKKPWFHWDRYYRHDVIDPIVPARGHSKVEKEAIASLLSDIEGGLLKQSCPQFPPNVQLNYAYMQYGSLEGVKIITVHRSSAGSTIKFCRTASQWSYGVTLFGEGDLPLGNTKLLKTALKSSVGLLGRAVGDLLGVREENEDVPGGGRNKFPKAPRELPALIPPDTIPSANHRIIFVIPLQGRYRALEQFMESYEKDFLKPAQDSANANVVDTRNVQLAIVLLGNDEQGDDLGLNRASAHLLRSYQNTYGSSLLRYHVASTGDRSFSRGAGIELGSLVGEENDILFFMDIDMVVTPNLVTQCRQNIRQGRNAWYPVPYSQYDPDKLCFHDELPRHIEERHDLVYDVGAGPVPKESSSRERQLMRESIKRTPLTLNRDRGFWRDFGFGIACMYKSDFIATGGFDLTIEGWGEEDVRLYVSLIQSGIDVFRVRQKDLVHIFHHKYCDADISGEQAKACRRTKASHFASQKCLANMWFKTYIAR
ncbi:chondroitin sulfate synthase 1-like [Styela clava]